MIMTVDTLEGVQHVFPGGFGTGQAQAVLFEPKVADTTPFVVT